MNLDFRARHEGRELCLTEREVVPRNPKVLARGEWTQLGHGGGQRAGRGRGVWGGRGGHLSLIHI